MLLFHPSGGRHCQRYVGQNRSPLRWTACSHLAASALSLYLVIVLSLCVGAFGADQRPLVFEKARVWRSSPRVTTCRVLPQRRVGVRLPLLRGRQSRTARLGLNSLFYFYRWRTHRERIQGTVRVDVCYLFAPFIAVPGVMVFRRDEEGTTRADQMLDHGQFGASEQTSLGHFHVPDQVRSPDQDPPAPGTVGITGHDLLWPPQGDAAFTDRDQDPPCLRFLEDLVS